MLDAAVSGSEERELHVCSTVRVFERFNFVTYACVSDECDRFGSSLELRDDCVAIQNQPTFGAPLHEGLVREIRAANERVRCDLSLASTDSDWLDWHEQGETCGPIPEAKSGQSAPLTGKQGK